MANVLVASIVATTVSLVKDFRLIDSKVREDNINRFMAHIGERQDEGDKIRYSSYMRLSQSRD
jgi:hypothetical protein